MIRKRIVTVLAAALAALALLAVGAGVYRALRPLTPLEEVAAWNRHPAERRHMEREVFDAMTAGLKVMGRRWINPDTVPAGLEQATGVKRAPLNDWLPAVIRAGRVPGLADGWRSPECRAAFKHPTLTRAAGRSGTAALAILFAFEHRSDAQEDVGLAGGCKLVLERTPPPPPSLARKALDTVQATTPVPSPAASAAALGVAALLVLGLLTREGWRRMPETLAATPALALAALRGAALAVASSWWIQLAFAALALLVAGDWQTVIALVAAMLLWDVMAWLPVFNRATRIIAGPGRWFNGVVALPIIAGAGVSAGGVAGYAAALLAAWAAYSAGRGRTLAAALGGAEWNEERVAEVQNTHREGVDGDAQQAR